MSDSEHLHVLPSRGELLARVRVRRLDAVQCSRRLNRRTCRLWYSPAVPVSRCPPFVPHPPQLSPSRGPTESSRRDRASTWSCGDPRAGEGGHPEVGALRAFLTRAG